MGCVTIVIRSGSGGDSTVAEDANGDEPIRLRDLQQGFSEGPEPAAAPERPQPAVEAAAAGGGEGGEEEGLRVPGEELRPPRPRPRPRRPHRHQEAL